MNNIENLKDLIIYQSQNNENISIEVLYDEEDFWLTQKSMSELFGVEVNTINYHLKEIFKSQELQEKAVIRKIRITANDGKNYNTNFYSLDAIIAVGYRVNSKEATDFRIWATNTLKEYIKKGFENINLTTYGFQAPEFYKKCGFEVEFIRKNKKNSKLDKYYLVKYFGGN